ncbi:MAG TPA: hypothetical protein VD996_00545 [Chitinophagaceae bacterium]|nr:hypothetical protein [Chitinophagaceae bacterium]
MNPVQPSSTNFASVRTPIFTDTLYIQLAQCLQGLVEAILLDEHGTICGRMETNVSENEQEVAWKGLNDLPYGIYTLQLQQGAQEMNMRIVKRV